MFKLITVFLFTVVFVTGTMQAQTVSDLPKAKENRTDLRQVISKETQKLKNQSSSIDNKEMEKIARQQSSRSNWTKKQTAFLVIFAVAVAALVVLLVKYGKDCLRYENNCDPAFDENCYCEEYEQNRQSRKALTPANQSFVPQFNRNFSFKVGN
jgi:hypothetical protein